MIVSREFDGSVGWVEVMVMMMVVMVIMVIVMVAVDSPYNKHSKLPR